MLEIVIAIVFSFLFVGSIFLHLVKHLKIKKASRKFLEKQKLRKLILYETNFNELSVLEQFFSTTTIVWECDGFILN